MERSLDDRRERTRREVEALLGAARGLLERHGFARLRVDDVLEEAGMSTRAFYRHFRGKEELFLALLEEEADRAAGRLDALVGAAGGPEQQVRAWVRGVLVLAYDPRLARRTRVFSREQAVLANRFPQEIDRCIRLQVAPLEAAIAAGRDDGLFPGAEPERDARVIHHLCAGLMQDRLGDATDLSRDRAIALAATFALQALRSDGDERGRLR